MAHDLGVIISPNHRIMNDILNKYKKDKTRKENAPKVFHNRNRNTFIHPRHPKFIIMAAVVNIITIIFTGTW